MIKIKTIEVFLSALKHYKMLTKENIIRKIIYIFFILILTF